MKRFFKDFMIYGLASILGKVAAVLLMPIYTNILTKEEYGAMALIIASQGVIGLFSNLNIHSGIARDYHEEGIDKNQLVSTGVWSILGVSSIILSFMLLTRKFWLTNVLGLDSIYIIPFTLMLFTIPASSLLSYFAILTRFKKKPILYSIGTILQLFVQLSISIIGVVFLRLGILSIFAGTLCGELFGILYYSYINHSNIAFSFNKEYIKRALLFSIPTLPAILAGWIDSSMGQIIIGKYISTADLGVYSIALQLSSVFAFISIGLNNVWLPYLYENYNKEGFLKEINRLYTVIVLILTIIAISVSLMSKEIVLLLSNSSYINASKYFTLLCIPMCVYLLFPVVTSGISISRDTKYISISYIAGSVINIAFLFMMINSIGVYSVPIALGLSRIATYSILYYISKSKGIIVLPNGVLVLLIASILVCFIIININLGTIYRAAIVVLACGAIAAYIVKSINIKHFITERKIRT